MVTESNAKRRNEAVPKDRNVSTKETIMSLDSRGSQMSKERRKEDKGEAPTTIARGTAETAEHGNEPSTAASWMQEVVAHGNLRDAVNKVRRNKGAAGVDGMSVDALESWFSMHEESLRKQLLAGIYKPQPVRRVEIPKSDGGIRALGIPTAIDRVVQQAVLQVMQPRIDPSFSEHSYGFRPGRSAHQAIDAAKTLIAEGFLFVVDVDLQSFFDRVNHDVLMARVARRVEDKALLKLIRAFLNAGIMANGVVIRSEEGTPQGGPLSPLLANILLDEVDKELEERGHRFVRYADDCNVYVRTEKAAQRVLESLRKTYARLHLRINESKSAAAKVWGRPFLSFTFYGGKGARRGPQIHVSKKARAKFSERIRLLTRRGIGQSLAQVVKGLKRFITGWKAYFVKAQSIEWRRVTDEWIRHRLRMIRLKQLKRGTTTYRWAIKMGLNRNQAVQVARHKRSWWGKSHQLIHLALPNPYFEKLGLPSLTVALP